MNQKLKTVGVLVGGVEKGGGEQAPQKLLVLDGRLLISEEIMKITISEGASRRQHGENPQC